MDVKLATSLIGQIGQSQGLKQAAGSGSAAGFSKALDSALQSVSQTQASASGLQQQFQLGNPNVTLEQTMVAMQKSQIGFQAAVTVRNRLVSAYTDIMNMPV